MKACDKCGKRHVVKAKAGGPRCQGHAKSGGQCGRNALAGRKQCKLHGGAALRGEAHPAFKHGRYTQSLPKGLVELFDAANADADYLVARDEMALATAHLTELVTRLAPEVDHPERMEHIAGQLKRCELIKKDNGLDDSGKLAQVYDVLDEVFKQLEPLLRTRKVWNEIQGWQEHKRRLMDSERKRLEAAEHSITVQQVQAILRLVLNNAREFIEDEGRQSAFMERLAGLDLMTGEPRDGSKASA